MTYDPKERMNADQKEAEGASNVDFKPAAGIEAQRDTELAADTWMGAALNPEANKPKGRGTMSYDPNTQTESYRGDASLEGGGGGSAMANGTAGQQMAGQQAAGGAGSSTQERPVVKRMIVDDDVADWERETRYETAAEVAPPANTRIEPRSPVSEPETENNPGGGMGMTALGLSILSLFLLPYLVAPIGIIVGYLAFRRGARTMGIWAMVIGAIAILGAMVIYPYFVAR